MVGFVGEWGSGGQSESLLVLKESVCLSVCPREVCGKDFSVTGGLGSLSPSEARGMVGRLIG